MTRPHFPAVDPDTKLPSAAVQAAWANITSIASKVDRDELRIDVLDHLSGGDHRAAIISALALSAATGGVVELNGTHSISDFINVPSGATIDGSRGVITQTGSLKQVFIVNNASRVHIRNVKATGKGSDWVNNSSVYGATAIEIKGTSSDVTVEGCDLSNFAGGGLHLFSGPTTTKIRGNRIVGPGAPPITGTSDNYGGGIVIDTGSSDFEISGNDISQFCQGIVTGDINDFVITGNHIHDIPGQHGMYLESCVSATIAGNLIVDVALQGIKIQLGNPVDSDGVTISGNTIINSGSHAILLTNLAGANFLRNFAVVGNVLKPADSNGVSVIGGRDFVISGNVIKGGTNGVRLDACTTGIVTGCFMSEQTAQGVVLVGASSDIQFSHLRIKNPATANGGSTEWGVGIEGTCSDLTFDDVRVSDANGNMRYGFYNTSSNQATISVRNCSFTGATDYGARLDSAQGLREWRNNICSGTSGQTLNFPTAIILNGTHASDQYGTAAPASGAYLRGARVWHSTPAVGSPIGWICTAAGSPGTWVAMANL